MSGKAFIKKTEVVDFEAITSPTNIVTADADNVLGLTTPEELAETISGNFLKVDPTPDTEQTFIGGLKTRGFFESFAVSGSLTRMLAQGLEFIYTGSAFKALLGAVAPFTADRTLTIPDASGTIALQEEVDTLLADKADLVAGKIPIVQIPDSLIGSVNYQGTYNAATDTPTLPTATGNEGYYYVINTAGTVGGISFSIGDWIISNGTTWEKLDQTYPVDATVIDGSNNAVSGNAVFDALALKANLASPTFTGSPQAPTPTAGNNTTLLATTAFVKTALGNYDSRMAVMLIAGGSTVTLDANSFLRPDGTSAGELTVFAGSGTNLTITLPDPATGATRRLIRVIKANSSFTVTVQPPSGTINGSASIVLSNQYDTIETIPDGTNYYANTTSGLVAQTITNGVTTSAPSQDVVFDALAGKANISGGNAFVSGRNSFADGVSVGTTDTSSPLMVSRGANEGFEVQVPNIAGNPVYLLSYDRTAMAFKPLNFFGSSFLFNQPVAGGDAVNANEFTTKGQISAEDLTFTPFTTATLNSTYPNTREVVCPNVGTGTIYTKSSIGWIATVGTIV